MAWVRASRSGNWSDTNPATSPWSWGGVIYAPDSADNVHCNGFDVGIDVNVTAVMLATGSPGTVAWKDGGSAAPTTSGSFVPSNGVVITANVNYPPLNSTNGKVVVNTGANATIIGHICGSGNSSTGSITVNGGTLSIVGDIYGVYAVGGATVTVGGVGNLVVTGNLYAFPTGSLSNGNNIIFSSGGNLVLVGSIYAQRDVNVTASGMLAVGSTGNINITGLVRARHQNAIQITSASIVTIQGDVYGSDFSNVCHGITATSNCTVNITGNVFASLGTGLNFNTTTSVCYVSGNITGSSANLAIYGTAATLNFKGSLLSPSGKFPVFVPAIQSDGQVTGSIISFPRLSGGYAVAFYSPDAVGGNPSPSNVRRDVQYGPTGDVVGTCHVPAASSVAAGVPVDNTIGTAVLTPAAVQAIVGAAVAGAVTND